LVVPLFSDLSAPTITYGTASAQVSGRLALSNGQTLPPGPGEVVHVMLNGATRTVPLDGHGNFTTTFPTAALNVAGSPYPVSFIYPGDADYPDVTFSSTLTVGRATPKVFVADANGTYNGKPFTARATVAGVNGIPGDTLESATPTLDYVRHNSDGTTTDLGAD